MDYHGEAVTRLWEQFAMSKGASDQQTPHLEAPRTHPQLITGRLIKENKLIYISHATFGQHVVLVTRVVEVSPVGTTFFDTAFDFILQFALKSLN